MPGLDESLSFSFSADDPLAAEHTLVLSWVQQSDLTVGRYSQNVELKDAPSGREALLKERDGKQAGTRMMIDVLLLGREHGAGRVRRAVEEALDVGCSSLGAIRYLLNVAQLKPDPAGSPIDIGVLSQYDRPQPTLGAYDQLRPSRLATDVIQ